MTDEAAPGDDPDEVTLWAGRLRAWPTTPAGRTAEGETVRSRRRSAGEAGTRAVDDDIDDTIRSGRVAGRGADVAPPSTGDTARAGRVAEGSADADTASADDTVVRAGSASDSAGSARSSADDVAHSGRAEAPSAGFSRESADDTGGMPSDGVDETTGPSRARRARRGGDVSVRPRGTADGGRRRMPGDLVPQEPSTTEPVARTPRSTPEAAVPVADPAPVDDVTEGLPHRRVGTAGAETVEKAAGERGAHVPVVLSREGYAPRREGPVRVPRTAAPRVPATDDAAAVRPRRAGGRARLLALAVAVGAGGAAAAAGLFLLLV